MKLDIILSIVVGAVLIAFILIDRMVIADFVPTFKKLETQRIITSNKLASAKIVYENLNHVRDLVQKNMTFPGQKDSLSHETIFFDFITTCVNDLKMNLVSCKPAMPVTAGKITIFSYDLELEGDFFSFGELCSKFENSRRIITVHSFNVSLQAGEKSNTEQEFRRELLRPGSKLISIRMRVNTYRIAKG